MTRDVHAVIAVKSLDRAKSRLAADFRPPVRSRLVLAMLADTVAAAVAVPAITSVTVVTPDAEVADAARACGARVLPEFTSGLNAALADAFAQVLMREGAVDLLALQADLPALRGAELTAALAAAPEHGVSLVADHQGTGTAALLVRYPTTPAPQFGPDSARRHRAAGATELTGHWPGLRLDVDTAADLALALELGAGERTAKYIAEIDWVAPLTAACRGVRNTP